MLDGLSLDPYIILGVARGASSDELRDAFRRKSKKHHPDHGGDEWAFRIVLRAYESLAGDPGPEAPAAPAIPAAEPGEGGRIRPGVHDKDVHPSRLVLIEVVWMRYEVDDVLQLIGEKGSDRDLGGALNLTWPDPDHPGDPRAIPYADRILLALNGAFDEMRLRPGVLKARSHIDEGRFKAWLNYSNGHTAAAAFKHLRTTLKARGLGVRQWTRDLSFPRE